MAKASVLHAEYRGFESHTPNIHRISVKAAQVIPNHFERVRFLHPVPTTAKCNGFAYLPVTQGEGFNSHVVGNIVVHHIGVCYLPVTQEIAGSNPVATARCSVRLTARTALFRSADKSSILLRSTR